MSLAEKLVAARKRKGLTQNELAELTNVTVRTIQRIESGETTPRSFTLKAIAASLSIPFEELIELERAQENAIFSDPIIGNVDHRDFLQTLCLSCFGYLVIPYVHFLIPFYLLKKSLIQDASVRNFGKQLVREQVIWVITLNASLLLTLAYNILFVQRNHMGGRFNYLILVGIWYLMNAALIIWKWIQVKRLLPITTSQAN